MTVDSPELKAELGGANKYHVYHVHGQDKTAEFSVYRRYSDFVTLKTAMMSRWPGIYIPALPEKKFIGNNESIFLDTRRRGLEEFLKHIAGVKYLWYGDVVVMSCRNSNCSSRIIAATWRRAWATWARPTIERFQPNTPRYSRIY